MRRSVVSALRFGCVTRDFPAEAVAVWRLPAGVSVVMRTCPFEAFTSEPTGIDWPAPRGTKPAVPGLRTLTTPADRLALTVSPTAGAPVTSTVSVSALFVASGSASAWETVAPSEIVPPRAGTDVSLTVFLVVVLSPGRNVPSSQPQISFGTIAAIPPEGSNARSRTTSPALPGPLLVVVVVKVTLSPARADSASATTLDGEIGGGRGRDPEVAEAREVLGRRGIVERGSGRGEVVDREPERRAGLHAEVVGRVGRAEGLPGLEDQAADAASYEPPATASTVPPPVRSSV